MEWLEKYTDNPLILLAGWILWQLLIQGTKQYNKWKESKGKSNSFFASKLHQLVIEAVAENYADKGFIIRHDDSEGHYSIVHEYSPRTVAVERFYKKVPFDDKARWAMDKLRSEGVIICDTLEEVGHAKHQGEMKEIGLNSWYCFKLTKGGKMIGSLNLYFKSKYGMSKTRRDTLTGMLSWMGDLLSKEMNEK